MQRVCLVTGASRGIGAAIADSLGALGHVVIGTATTDSGATRISERFAAAGIAGTGMALDVASPAAIDDVLARIVDAYGAPLILVNNAGITRDNILMRMKEEEWQGVIDTNLSSVFRLSKAVMRAMTKARWGRIVSVSSVVGSMGNAGQANYAASKAGMEGFSRSLAREIGSRGITVNCVAPGFIDTDMTRELPDQQRQGLLEQIPAGRLGDAAEVAAVVAFLASESAGYVTGETIHVNGGMYMR
ncbi:MAG: 3-oxoacyl-ACP reductase FabG [Gammaproteobacteria bacterium]|jgi:3-oxoacyl-[acyl-carrier protein] reductase|nr:3-oxoacyl-ACP reductase FabG [Gammaproteobacteria bacterium]MBP6050655.1 3-oxoacyl-ACP reductase FabG [Pseudomonadales bacterium]MBK6585470.1 3-oxoacyl-ACP reductase FabG [Gammaproteobacteria bacterium]MBK7168882.1 3-oxoacyl-ACP reductase FabG [Gammaproteobacteria bacterium]MBK7521034.1 3-oxoacyl-ACP reductase FabG [Gammaproteobacteria bacterium]